MGSMWRCVAWFGGFMCVLLLAAGVRAAELQLPPGPNRDLVYGACRTCHDLEYLKESAGVPREAWNELINSMGQYGLRLPPGERGKILDYLATYLGPHPPPASAAPATTATKVDGASLFQSQCSVCHQPNGQGVAGTFPPLAGNHDLFRDRLLPVYVLLNGMSGPIEAKGQSYNGAMPSMAHLSNAEIAAVVNYVRGAWGNAGLRPAGMAAIDAATVKQLRAKPMTPQAVHAYRAGLQ